MAVLLLRTLTRKSVIGFGQHRELTVQNMIDTCRTHDLLHIYYSCRNIDFNQDLKDELCIYGEREINKKEYSEIRYISNARYLIGQCMREMIDKKDDVTRQKELNFRYKMKVENRKHFARKERWLKSTIYSKGAMQARNQGHYKKS